jgi:hypothetical protein
LCLSICQLFCGEGGTIWPKPTGHIVFGNYIAKLNPNEITIIGIDFRNVIGQLLQKNVDKLQQNIKSLAGTNRIKQGGYSLIIKVIGNLNNEVPMLTLNTSEDYTLNIYQENNNVF